ncbi:MAG: diacylglycerol kinase family protein [Candidatus Nanoarchaeia archaeon]|nr:diacylglycerol kinase family protein [Candidatus Nanoarchaeia archaeon]
MTAIVLTNKNSGKNLRDKFRIHRMRKFVGDRGEVFATSSVEQLEFIVSELYRHKPKQIISDGGDGTQCQIVKLLNKYWPKAEPLPALGILPGGTINILAKECGIKKGKKYMKGVLESKEEDLFYQDIDFMRIRDSNNVESYGFTFGLGAPIVLLEEYYKRKKWKAAQVGFILGRLLLSKIFGSSKLWRERYYNLFNQKQHIHAYAGTNGSAVEWDADFLGIMAQSIKSLGLPKSKMFYRAQQSTGNFHAMGTSAELIDLVPYFVPMYLGKKIPGMDIDVQTSYFSVSSEQPIKYQVNGELEYFVGNEAKKYSANSISVEHGLTLKIIKAAP